MCVENQQYQPFVFCIREQACECAIDISLSFC